MEASRRFAVVRSIRSARVLPLVADDELRALTVRISLTPAALTRLLSITGTQDRFIISSSDGRTAVQVRLEVADVPDGEQALGDGRLLLNWSRGTLTHGARQTILSRTELRLLAALIDAAPAVLPKLDLVERLWPDEPGRSAQHERSLKVWICQLRRHFAAVGVPDAINTVRGVGYRLIL